MRKYSEVIRIHFKAQLVWRAEVFFQMLFTVSKIAFAYLLWGIIFQTRSEVAGFTFHGMLSYYVVSSFLSSLDVSAGLSEEISARIRNGTFSNYMVLPIRLQGYFISMELGVMAFYFLLDLLASVLWAVFFQIRLVLTQDIFVITCALLMIALGLLFMLCLNFYLGILTLKYEEIRTFLMIKNNLILLVTGGLVPLALFPERVTGLMKLLPFYYVTYLPSMLLTGRCREEAVTGLLVLAGWCLGLQLLLWNTWRRYRKNYEGVGI